VDADRVVCARCDREMEEGDVTLTYLDHQVTARLPVCPVCGQVYISEEVVTGKIQRVERELEDK
jgi:hypothetical protein